jgi:hypothetical protein
MGYLTILLSDIHVMHHLNPDAKGISNRTPYQTAEYFFEQTVVYHLS